MSDRNTPLESLRTQRLEIAEQLDTNSESILRRIDSLHELRIDGERLDRKLRTMDEAIELLTPADCASNVPTSPPANPVQGGELTIGGDAKAKLVLDLAGHPQTTLEFPAPPDGHPIAAALKTLKALGYEHTGGVEWRPPHGPAPVFEDEQMALIKAVQEARDAFRLHQAGLSRSELDRLAAYLKQGGKFAGDIPNAMNALTAAMDKDLGYAWSWHCNIAGPIADALAHIGVTLGHREANYAAAALMRHMFSVDMERDGHYRDTQKPTATELATPASSPAADEHKLYTERASAARTMLRNNLTNRKIGEFVHLTQRQAADILDLLHPTKTPGETSIAQAAEAAKDLKGFDLGTDDHSAFVCFVHAESTHAEQLKGAPLIEGELGFLDSAIRIVKQPCQTAELVGADVLHADQATTAEEDEAFAELASKRGAGEVAAAKEPIKVNLTYDWAQFVHYGQENTADPITHGLPWSFRFHGHPVTHENDTCYIVGGNSGADSLYFHKGDIITVDSETNDISIKSPATPDALAPEVPEQPIALDMDAVAKAAMTGATMEADLDLPAEASGAMLQVARERLKRQHKIDAGLIIPPAIGRRVWFHPFQPSPNVKVHSVEQALDAGVVYVWSDNMVNLDVTDHAGNHHAFTSVRLVQPEDATIPVGQNWAEWMPFQVKQAQAAK